MQDAHIYRFRSLVVLSFKVNGIYTTSYMNATLARGIAQALLEFVDDVESTSFTASTLETRHFEE